MPFFVDHLQISYMEVIEEKKDDLNAELVVKIEPSDYKENYEKSLRKHRKQINLPGFRNGKVPIPVVKKKYGKSILADELNNILNQAIYEHITKNNLDVLGNPLPSNKDDEAGDWDNPKTFEFKYEVGLAPEFEVNLTPKQKFKYHKVKIDDKLIDQQIEDLTRRYGKMESAEVSEEKDMLLGQFAELDKSGSPKEEGVQHSSTISIEYVEDKKTKKKLIGLKVGDSIELNPEKVSKGEEDMASMLGIDKERVKELSKKFEFKVTEIKRIDPAELNQELFDKLFGEGNVKSEEGLRKRIQEELEKNFTRDSDRLFYREFAEQLKVKLKLKLPDEFLKKWIMTSNEKPITEEQLEQEYEGYAEGLKWQLIQNKLIKENDLKVEDQEVIDFTKGLILNNYAQYNMPFPGEEELEKNARSVLENKEEARRVYDMLYDQKILEHVKNTVKLNEKEVAHEDFVKMAAAE